MATFEELCQALIGLDRVNGITLVDVLGLPAPLDRAIKKLLREPLSGDRLAQEIQLPASETRQLLEILVDKGFLEAEEQANGTGRVYKVYFARMRRHNLPSELIGDE